MTCAKVTVTCTITTLDNIVVFGSNACSNPQPVCPREPGEDYTKCTTICKQQGHAEVQALASARREGVALAGATAVQRGHTYFCRQCQEALFGAGVKFLARA